MKKKEIRQNFRDEVFKRDGHKCVFCDCRDDLDAHHIVDRHEMPNGGYVKENGITLCPKHHLDAEAYHMSDGKSWTEGMHPLELYDIIGSSLELAEEMSRRLK